MFYDYAVDPALFSDINIFNRFIHESFSLLQGRIIAKYPRKGANWWGMVRDIIQVLDDQDQSYIIDWYSTGFNDDLSIVDFVGADCYYDNSKTWLENAEIIYENYNCFHAIIAKENPRNKSYVIVVPDANRKFSIDNEKFTKPVDTSRIISNKTGFLESIDILIKYSNEIFLIDPYFSGDKKWGVLINVLFKCILKYKKVSMIPTYITFVKEEDIKTRKESILCINNRDKLYKNNIPEGMKLSIYLVNKTKKDHDRCILTDWWGIEFSRGLDATFQTQQARRMLRKDYEEDIEYYRELIDKKMNIDNRVILTSFFLGNNGECQ